MTSFVSTSSYSDIDHVLGKGKGYGDIEYAMMRQLGACDDKTLVVTTVHESQLLDDLPSSLMTEHDLYVHISLSLSSSPVNTLS